MPSGVLPPVTSLALNTLDQGLALIPITPRFCSKSTACDQNGRMVAMEPAVSILVELQGSSVLTAPPMQVGIAVSLQPPFWSSPPRVGCRFIWNSVKSATSDGLGLITSC